MSTDIPERLRGLANKLELNKTLLDDHGDLDDFEGFVAELEQELDGALEDAETARDEEDVEGEEDDDERDIDDIEKEA